MSKIYVLLAVVGTVFFLVRGVQMHSGYRAMGQLEAKRVELEAARERENRKPLRVRIRARVLDLGYDGDLFPFAAAMAFLYLALAGSLTLTPLPLALDYILSLPAALAVVWAVAQWSVARKRKAFNTQLVDLLDLVSGQIEGGTGAQRALAVVVPSMREPLRGEMTAVLDAQFATTDLIGAMRELSNRYPSRAFSMFISALEIDRADGHAIAPALRQAASLINNDIQLRAEANAEISQQRSEFLAILAVMGAIAGYMILSGDPARAQAYTSPIGLLFLSLGMGNVVWGSWRMLTTLRKLQGSELL